jgi:GTP-binding protein Era
VALAGAPNVGKSTLLNALAGERLSIVTARAQTTRERVLGIVTDEQSQLVLVDTPGLLEPRYLFHRAMLAEALRAVREADLVLLLLDATRPEERPPAEPLALLASRRPALFVAVNKVDAGEAAAVVALEAWAMEALGVRAHRLAAKDGTGVERLRTDLVAALPERPFLYPPDDIAAQPVRFFVAEFIRETIFERYEAEIPYATVVRIEEFREAADPVYIRATIYVERESQKPILLGRGGAAVRALGAAARAKIEAFLDTRVFLDLWVKVLPQWRKKASALQYLGYRLPSKGDAAGS